MLNKRSLLIGILEELNIDFEIDMYNYINFKKGKLVFSLDEENEGTVLTEDKINSSVEYPYEYFNIKKIVDLIIGQYDTPLSMWNYPIELDNLCKSNRESINRHALEIYSNGLDVFKNILFLDNDIQEIADLYGMSRSRIKGIKKDYRKYISCILVDEIANKLKK